MEKICICLHAFIDIIMLPNSRSCHLVDLGMPCYLLALTFMFFFLLGLYDLLGDSDHPRNLSHAPCYMTNGRSRQGKMMPTQFRHKQDHQGHSNKETE